MSEEKVQNPIKEVPPLEVLNKDPRDYTEQEIAEIVAYYRQERVKFAAEGKKAVSKGKVHLPASGISLTDLDLKL